MKKGLMFALVLVCALAIVPCVFAAPASSIAVTVTITQTVSVTVTPNSHAFGATTEGQNLSTALDAFTAVNDGNGSESLTITVANSANWQAAPYIGKDAFVMNYTVSGTNWTLITPNTGATLVSGLAKGGNQKFGLQLLVPTATDFAGVQQSINVTVTASVS